MPKKRDLDDLIGPTAAANILETSPETVRRWALRGVLASISVSGTGASPGRSLYHRADVERLAEQRRRGPKAAAAKLQE